MAELHYSKPAPDTEIPVLKRSFDDTNSIKENMIKGYQSIWLLLTCLLLQVGSDAQFNVDSLRKVLEHEKTDSATIAGHLAEIETLSTTEQEPYMMIGNWAINKSTQLGNNYLLSLSNLSLGFVIISTSTDFAAATEYFTKAQSLAAKHHFPAIESQALNGLAHVYGENGQDAKHEEYTLRSIAISQRINQLDGVAAGYANLSSNLFKRRLEDPANLARSIYYLLLSIATAESINDSSTLIVNYMSASRLYSEAKKFDSAAFYLGRSALFIKNTGSDQDYNRYYYYKGSLAHEQGNYPEAIRNYQASVDYSLQFNIPTYAFTAYKAMTKTYKAMGDYTNALYYTEKLMTFEDSVRSAENFAKATDIQNKYEREKKDNQLLQKDLQLQTASEKRRRLNGLLLVSFITLSLLGVFSLLLLKNIRARKKAYQLLEEKSIQIQEQAVELSKQTRLIAKFQSQMNPHFVFNALHNIQGLVISGENQTATSQIQSLAQLMRKTFANAEKDDIPLEEEISYLQKYIDFERTAFDNNLEFAIETAVSMEHVLIPPMMIQPFVENAIKHAGLKKVENPYIRVLIGIENDLLSISVRDNGVGMKKETVNPDMLSHSMSVIKARIQLLFQEKNNVVNENLFIVKTVPDVEAGTMVKFYLPLNYAY